MGQYPSPYESGPYADAQSPAGNPYAASAPAYGPGGTPPGGPAYGPGGVPGGSAYGPGAAPFGAKIRHDELAASCFGFVLRYLAHKFGVVHAVLDVLGVFVPDGAAD